MLHSTYSNSSSDKLGAPFRTALRQRAVKCQPSSNVGPRRGASALVRAAWQQQHQQQQDPQQPGPAARSKQRVCIVGGGCAGLTAAWAMSKHPGKFEVELWEAGSRMGGHANTLQLREGLVMNDTVLGGTYAGFANTLALLQELGWQEHYTDIPVTFAGAGVPGDPSYLWSTTPQSSPLYQKHAQDIARFTRALQQLWDSQQVLLLLLTPLRLLCRVIGCGDAFWDEMVNPLGVIFFGTGQRMDACPAIILAGALFQSDPAKGAAVLQLDPQRLVAPLPLPFFKFPRMDLLYDSFTAQATAGGDVQVKLNHPAVAVHSKSSAASKAVARDTSSSSSQTSSTAAEPVVVLDSQGQAHAFDAVIMACHAPAALQLLQQPSWVHKAALGGVEYHPQSTIMHTDEEYIRRYHPSLLQFQGAAWSVQQMPKAGSRDSSNINDTANRQAGGTASSGSMPEGCELVYQLGVAHLQRLSDIDTARSVALARELNTAVATAASKAAVRAVAEGTFAAATCSSPSQTSHTAAGAVQEQEQQQVGQRAFHNLPGGATHVWQVALPVGDALGRLDPAKVLSVRHWEHPAHTVKHFLKTLAFWRPIQGQGGVYFAGGYTFVDTHEYAIISGLAAAEQLGCPYPWPELPKAKEAYAAYRTIVYGA